MKITAAAGVAIALVVMIGGGGVAYAVTSTPDAVCFPTPCGGLPQDVVIRTAAIKTEPTAGGVHTTVATMSLPSGAWVVGWRAGLVNFGPSDHLRCSVFQNGVDLGGAAALVGDPSLPGARGPGALIASVSNYAAIGSGPAAVSLECWHDHTVGGGAPAPYVDASATLVAHHSSALRSLVQ